MPLLLGVGEGPQALDEKSPPIGQVRYDCAVQDSFMTYLGFLLQSRLFPLLIALQGGNKVNWERWE